MGMPSGAPEGAPAAEVSSAPVPQDGHQMAVRSPQQRLHVTLMGRSGVGKSAMTLRYTKEFFVEKYESTIEDQYEKNAVVNGIPACVSILDTAGQENYSSLRRSWMQYGKDRGERGFLFVFSLVE